MKRNYKTAALLLLVIVLLTGMQAFAREKTKEYNESWPQSSVQTLEINNKFGDVNVTHKGGDDVTIDVVVTVEAPDEQRADELLDMIDVSFNKTGGTVRAATHIGNDFKSRQKFSIDYDVNIPPGKNLGITNKYGNTFVNELSGNGTFDIQYGNFTANELNSATGNPVDLRLAYGKSNVETAGNMTVTVQYSTMGFGQLDALKLESKYTVINLDEAGSVDAESKYDTFNFGEVGSVSANTKYTKIRVDELMENLEVDAGYGGINVNRVNPGFESVSITNSYGQISLGLGNASYSLDASCNYCGISYPEDDFSGDRVSENQSQEVKGTVGNGSGGTVVVNSRYGQIKLH